VKIHLPIFAVGDDKKKREANGKKARYHTKSQKGYISAIWGADHLGPISTKIAGLKGPMR